MSGPPSHMRRRSISGRRSGLVVSKGTEGAVMYPRQAYRAHQQARAYIDLIRRVAFSISASVEDLPTDSLEVNMAKV